MIRVNCWGIGNFFLNTVSMVMGFIIYVLSTLKYKAIMGVLLLYAIYAFQPAMNFRLYTKTLFLAPGEILSLILGGLYLDKIFLKTSQEEESNNMVLSGLSIMGFLFLIATLTFFLFNNDLAGNMPRSLLMFTKWLLAPILFFIALNSKISCREFGFFILLLIASFIVSVYLNINDSYESLSAVILKGLATQYTRLSFVFPDPNQLGEITVLFLIISISGLINAKIKWVKMSTIIFTGLLLIILALTQSRESISTFIIAIFSLGIFKWRTRKPIASTVIFSLAIFVSLSFIHLVPRFWETIAQINSGETMHSLNARDNTWTEALAVVTNYPLGIGFENLSYVTNGQAWQAHNAFLQAAVISGLPGFFAYIYLIYSLFITLKSYAFGIGSQAKWLAEAYLGFLIGYLVTSFFSDHFITFYVFNAIFFGLLGLVVRIYNISSCEQPN